MIFRVTLATGDATVDFELRQDNFFAFRTGGCRTTKEFADKEMCKTFFPSVAPVYGQYFHVVSLCTFTHS